ncbi:MAG: formate dehydrogenase accessory sulfurtransferase FdhD [Planctomycetes bacterium]|nr:formate dehydrogenase accessory sulfurtransferase FdhD [Planctomycetota bacterium]
MQPPPESGLRSVPTNLGPDQVLVEEPLLIEVGEETILTMRTPGHDPELALGFLLGEGILASANQVERLETVPVGEDSPTARVRAHLTPGVTLTPLARSRLSRAHAIRPSCGLCGLASAEGLTRALTPPASGQPATTLEVLTRIANTMRSRQHLFRATGGSHAAAIACATSGEVWAVREDIGRHNALDKAVGACAHQPLAEAAVVLSGRGGYELVLKAARLGIPIVASVSAPSSLAVDLADELGMTLIGFLREGGGRVYADDGRLEDLGSNA